MSNIGMDDAGQPVQVIKAGTHQVVAYTGTAGQSAAFGSDTTLVRVVATTACHIAFGSNPTATTSSVYLPADAVEYFAVDPGHKVSAIQVSAGGNLHVTEAF